MMKSALLLLVLLSCSSKPTSLYSGGTFGEKKLGERIFMVTFQGDSFSTEEHVQEMLNVRCAEIALQNGSRYYIVMKDRQRMEGLAYGGLVPVVHSQSYKSTQVIQLSDSPIPNTINYDAYEMFHSYRKKLKIDE